MAKKQKWILPLVLVLVVVLLLGSFWDTAKVYLAPKTVLTEALANTAQALGTRFGGSPVHVLTKGFDRSLRNTIQLKMTRPEALLGDVQYDMTLMTQLSPRRILGSGTAAAGDRVLDLGLYLDDDFAAITSVGLLGGGYYGITYDTFSQDIRKNGILAFLIGEETLSEWEASMDDLQQTMWNTLELPEFSREDLKMAMLGLLALRPEVTRETVDLSRGMRECFRLRFQVKGELIRTAAEMADMPLPVVLDDNSLLTADFYLAEGYVVRCCLELTGPDAMAIALTGDTQPVTDCLMLDFSRGNGEHLGLTLNTVSSDKLYTEEITVRKKAEVCTMHYSWNSETGDGQLSHSGAAGKTVTALNLMPTENGFRIQTDDLDALLAILGEGEDKADTHATLTVTKGSDFAAPDYKNLDQWSMEDVLSLLGGLGGLLGLKL